MPISFRNMPKIKIGSKIKNLINQGLIMMSPITIIGLFLVISALFELLGKDVNWGFYVAFSVFIIGHFSKEILKKHA